NWPLTAIPMSRSPVALAASGLSNCRNISVFGLTQRYCRGACCPQVNGWSPNFGPNAAMYSCDSGDPCGPLADADAAGVPAARSPWPHAATASRTATVAVNARTWRMERMRASRGLTDLRRGRYGHNLRFSAGDRLKVS